MHGGADRKEGKCVMSGFEKLGRQIYARIWCQLQLFRIQFVRIPETPDAKSEEQLLQEILERLHREENI